MGAQKTGKPSDLFWENNLVVNNAMNKIFLYFERMWPKGGGGGLPYGWANQVL